MKRTRKLIANGARRWKWIVRRGGMEALAALTSITMVAGGVNLLLHPVTREAGPLLFPLAFGYILLALGIIGALGITFKSAPLLASFSFLGFMVRFWMALLYFGRDARDLSWVSFAVGALGLAWFFSRVVCDATARHVWRQKRRIDA